MPSPPPLSAYEPLLINVALTGVVGRTDRVPFLPVTAEQIVEDAIACSLLGAQIFHLHARGPDEGASWRREEIADAVRGIRRECPGSIVCVTTSGREFGEFEQRADVLELTGDAKPDMASLTLGSMNFGDSASVNSPQMIERLAGRMREQGIKPELEIFELGMAAVAERMLEAGELDSPLYANLILGAPNTAPATPASLGQLANAMPDETVWAAAGVGAFQLPVNATAVFTGGHVRTGLEDNPYFDFSKRSHATNPGLVRRIVDLADVAGRPLATAAQAREMLGLEAQVNRSFTVRPANIALDRDGMLAVLQPTNMHHIPSAEMHDFDVGHWYVAERDGSIVGVAGYRLIPDGDETVGKTTLLAVAPEQREFGIGAALQRLRMALMRADGALRVITNADRPETIAWYERNFGYRKIGELAKEHEFGLPDVDRWTTLEAPLTARTPVSTH